LAHPRRSTCISHVAWLSAQCFLSGC
jgi:hypothetical protein